MRHLILLPCDICARVPAMFVARCGLLVCQRCWHEETVLCEEVPGDDADELPSH